MLYVAAWVPPAVLLATFAVIAGGARWDQALALALPLVLVYGLLNLSSWYLCRSLPLERSGLPRLLLTQLLAAVLSSGLWLALGRLWAQLLESLPGRPLGELVPQHTAQLPLYFTAGVLLYLLAVAVHYLILASEASRRAEARAWQLQLLAREAELKALRAQLDPHFLFNSLHTIGALVVTEPETARHMCQDLGDFCRLSLHAGRRELVPLRDELALTHSFLAVERARFGERLRVREQVAEAALGCPVPPLLLQPLVENAVRHGIAQLLDGGELGLEVALRGEPPRLSLAVTNPRDPEVLARRGEGVGLENVRRRLAVRYGTQAWLRVAEAADSFRVQLELPVQPPAITEEEADEPGAA